MKTPILVLVLSLTFLMAIPTPIIHVNAVSKNNTNWSPFGPWNDNLLITVYSDFQAMFNAFSAGSLDITDWPTQPQDLNAGICSNPDFTCTPNEGQFGIFELDRNHHMPFLGDALSTPRVTGAAGVKSITTAPSGVCSAASGADRFIINLVNVETGSSAIQDPLNTVTIAENPVGSPSQSIPGSSTTNQYITTGCVLLANAYKVSTNVYSGTGIIPAQAPGLDVTVTLNVNYNSVSSSKPTAADGSIGAALAHMLDKVDFQNGPQLGGFSTFDDVFSPPSSGLIKCPSFGDLTDTCPNGAAYLPQDELNLDCANHLWDTTCTTTAQPKSLYSLANTVAIGCGSEWWGTQGCGSPNSQDGYPGVTDIRAACDHLSVGAGFALVGGTCQDLGNLGAPCTPIGACTPTTPACANPSAYTCVHLNPSTFSANAGFISQIIMYIRTSRPRRAFGQIIADGLDLLFGTPNNVPNNVVTQCVIDYGYLATPPNRCNPTYYTITQIFDVVFGKVSTAGVPPGLNAVDDFNLYTGGYSLTTFPDQGFGLGNSLFTGGVCGGTPVDLPSDYDFYCNPQVDGDTTAGEFAASLSASGPFLARAMDVSAVVDLWQIPVYTDIASFMGLEAWNQGPKNGVLQSSLVNQLGHGYQTGFQSLINMRCNDAFTPTNALYKCGGGTDGLIRRGFSQDVHKLSIYQALTVWDFEVISQVYDSLLLLNPRQGLAGNEFVAFMSKNVPTLALNPDGSGSTTWSLRNDLKWQDGVALTADDVCFSVLSIRDVPSANLAPAVSPAVSTCNVLNPTTFTVNCGVGFCGPTLVASIGGLPIVPAHLWASVCSWSIGPGQHFDSSTETGPVILAMQASNCANPAFDPMAAGIYVGSGPWGCKTGGGVIGGPCTSSGTQDVTLGQTITLSRYHGWDRCCPNEEGTSLQKISWADKNDDGVVNILDIADAALHYGTADTYWKHPLYTLPGDTTVDIGDIATIALYYGHGITSPGTPGSLANLDTEPVTIGGVVTDQGIDPWEYNSAPGWTMDYQTFLPTPGHLASAQVKSGTFAGTVSLVYAPEGSCTTGGGTVTATASGSLLTWTVTLTAGCEYDIVVKLNGVQIGEYSVNA